MAAQLVLKSEGPSLMWCHLNDEGKMLKSMVPDSIEVSGNDSDEFKEEAFCAFVKGDIRTLISKPIIGGFGLNFQNCAHQTFFPSHSFEQWYQAVRRSWRFGQKKPVVIDMITSDGESGVMANLMKKSKAAEKMFEQIISLMSSELRLTVENKAKTQQVNPSWL